MNDRGYNDLEETIERLEKKIYELEKKNRFKRWGDTNIKYTINKKGDTWVKMIIYNG